MFFDVHKSYLIMSKSCQVPRRKTDVITLLVVSSEMSSREKKGGKGTTTVGINSIPAPFRKKIQPKAFILMTLTTQLTI